MLKEIIGGVLKNDASKDSQFDEDVAEAEANVGEVYENDYKRREVAQRLAVCLRHERLVQAKHDLVNPNLFHAVINKLHIGDEPARRLVGLHDYLAFDEAAKDLHLLMGQKGISITLGYEVVLGDWLKTSELDKQFRALPKSHRLGMRGFRFGETYSDKKEAKRSYDFRILPSEMGNSLLGIRKRAAADVHADNGILYNIVKRSSFLIMPDELTSEEVEMLPDPTHHRRDVEAAQKAGELIIEPFLHDKFLRVESKSVLPVVNTYFALSRFEEDGANAELDLIDGSE